MVQFTIYMFILITSFIFMNMIHPLAMGLTLLIQMLFICLITGLMTKNFWYLYILFLIFLGGMLVLFIYVTSLASNEMFDFSIKLLTNLLIFTFLMFILYFMIDYNSITFIFNNNEMENLTNMNSYISENSLSSNKLYNYPNNFIKILLMNYLLITLIVIVKITKLSKGPLRMMM